MKPPFSVYENYECVYTVRSPRQPPVCGEDRRQLDAHLHDARAAAVDVLADAQRTSEVDTVEEPVA